MLLFRGEISILWYNSGEVIPPCWTKASYEMLLMIMRMGVIV